MTIAPSRWMAARSAAALLAALLATPAQAAPVSRSDLAPVAGEVIVRFKVAATVTRMHALSARAAPADVQATLSARAAALGTRLGRALESGAAVGDRTQVVRAAGTSAEALAQQLAADPDVEWAEPNGRRRHTAAPNDPYYLAGPALNTATQTGGPVSGQWYLRAQTAAEPAAINVEPAWARTGSSAGVVVAVLDTGVRADHPDLAGRLLPGYDFITNAEVGNDGGGRDADPADPGDWVTAADARTSTFTGCVAEDSSWHGTKTASLVAAGINDGIGMAGTARGVKVLPVRVLGKCFGTDSDIQAGMRWAAGIHVDGVPDNPYPAKVLNMSLGGTGTCSAGYQAAVNDVLARGAAIVAAGGNSAGGPVGVPANCAGVIGVTGLRHVGTKVGFSDLGTEISIAAPGGNCVNTAAGTPCLFPILAATNTGTQGPVSPAWTDSYKPSVGTSFSSPLVAATVAMMALMDYNATPAVLRDRLRATARPFPTTGGDNGDGSVVQQCRAPSSSVEQLQCYCNTTYCGAGMLDTAAAVAAMAAVPRVDARITLATDTPTAGVEVVLNAGESIVTGGAALTSAAWTLTDGGGIVTRLGGGETTSTVRLTPSAGGAFTLTLALTDGQGNTSLASRTVTVAAAGGTGGGDGGSGGGGGAAITWVALLGLAAAVLRRSRAGQAAAR